MTTEAAIKPLGRRAYGHIGHLPGSRMGPGDHHVSPGQARIATEKARDHHDRIIVQEKLDGSCVAVAKVDGEILALGRAGYLAQTSKCEQHQLFAAWVRERESVFARYLDEGERMVGEWLAQAHGTRYKLWHEPFVPFDLMVGEDRRSFFHFADRVDRMETMLGRRTQFRHPFAISVGRPLSIDEAMRRLGESAHGAIDAVEGAVWRVERSDGRQAEATGIGWRVDFLCKYVRPDKVDGSYLPEVTGGEPVWNWRPK